MKLIPLLCCCCLLLITPLSSVASDNKDQTRQPTKAQSKNISKEAATQLAQQRFPGRVLKVQSEPRQYRVRVMQDDGRVVNVVVDGQNGRVRREE